MENKPIPEEEEGEGLFEHYRIRVDQGQGMLRIDKYLFDRLPNVTRNKIQQAIHAGFVMVNDREIKPSQKIKPGDLIVVSLPQPPRDTEVLPENIPLDILFEDEWLMIVNKPAGMVVHPAHQNWTGTLVNALAYHFKNLPVMPENEGRPGLVHRIDKDTSGILLIAKCELAMMGLARQFYYHTIQRIYTALVWGVPAQPEGSVRAYIGRSPKDRKVMAVFEDPEKGKEAITHYTVIKDLRYVSLVECRLETGRTHQIRIHMKHLGHPLFNDGAYGGDKILKGTAFSKYKSFVENCFHLLPGQALHAGTLGFEHPISGKFMQFRAGLPERFQMLVDKWEHYLNYN